MAFNKCSKFCPKLTSRQHVDLKILKLAFHFRQTYYLVFFSNKKILKKNKNQKFTFQKRGLKPHQIISCVCNKSKSKLYALLFYLYVVNSCCCFSVQVAIIARHKLYIRIRVVYISLGHCTNFAVWCGNYCLPDTATNYTKILFFKPQRASLRIIGMTS